MKVASTSGKRFTTHAARSSIVLCMLAGLLLSSTSSIGCGPNGGQSAAEASKALSLLVDQYLDSYYRFHPSSGTVDGNHKYDSRGLDDVSPGSISREVTSVKDFKRRLAGIGRGSLKTDLATDYDTFKRHLEARLYEMEVLKPYSRDPYFYAEIIDESVTEQMIFSYSGTTLDSRLQVVLHQLDQVPALCEQAIGHLTSVSEEMLENGLDSLPDTKSLLSDDVPSVFAGARLPDGTPAKAVLQKKVHAATAAIDRLIAHLKSLQRMPGRKPSFALKEKLVKKLMLEQDIRLPANDPFGEILKKTLAQIGTEQQAFFAAARSIDPNRDPLVVWEEVQKNHPEPGQVVDVVSKQVAGIKDFLERKNICWIPTDETVTVKAARAFMLYWYASMWQTGPFEPTPAPPAVYYTSDPKGIIHGEKGQSDLEAQNEFLTAMVTPELWSTSAHESYPGHFLQGYWAKKLKRELVDKGELSDVAVSNIFAPYSFFEGWAHYTEQMVREEGLLQDADPRSYQEYLMGQRSDALLRLCRTYAGIQMNMGRMSVEEAVDFFMKNSFITRDAAEAEAIRGVYDPDYILYSIGKMMILELRDDYRKAVEVRGEVFDLRQFHDRFLSIGQYPLPVLRAKMLSNLAGSIKP